MIRFRPLWGLTVWTVLGLAMLVALGVWQLERLQWKQDLIARVSARMHEAPVPLGMALSESMPDPDPLEYRRVTVRGHFLHEKEMYLFAQGPGGAHGAQIITPFQWEGIGVLLVNRGFVPDAKRDPATRAAGQEQGELTVTGLIHDSTEPGWFTPPPDLKHREWFSRDAPSMAAASGVKLMVPFFIEADATPNPGGYPVGGQTVVDFPNSHLQYAITWFGLALALLGVYLAYHVRQGRLTFGK